MYHLDIAYLEDSNVQSMEYYQAQSVVPKIVASFVVVVATTMVVSGTYFLEFSVPNLLVHHYCRHHRDGTIWKISFSFCFQTNSSFSNKRLLQLKYQLPK